MNQCRICRQPLHPEVLLTLKNMPRTAQNFPTEKTLDLDRGVDLELHQCSACGVIQLTNEPVPYFREVIRAVAYSPEMKDFRLKQFSSWLEKYSLTGKKILEVGCGRGEYMELMRTSGASVFGVEGAPDSVTVCREKHLDAECIFFEKGNELLKDRPFDAFFILNWLEHIPDIPSMLRAVRANLVPDGLGLVEVPNFDMMLRERQIMEFTCDHLYYFTTETLRNTLEGNGFEFLDCRPVWHDYILSATVRKRPVSDFRPFTVPLKQFRREIDDFLAGNRVTAVWGAGHQALAVLSMMELSGRVAYVVDSAPMKQGKYTHATHIPIVSPERLEQEPPDGILVMCAAYSDEVVRILRSKFGNRIRIAVLREQRLEVLS